jgi:hypothetical protein
MSTGLAPIDISKISCHRNSAATSGCKNMTAKCARCCIDYWHAKVDNECGEFSVGYYLQIPFGGIQLKVEIKIKSRNENRECAPAKMPEARVRRTVPETNR